MITPHAGWHAGDDDLIPESFPNAAIGNLIFAGTFRRGRIGLVPDKSIRGRLPGFETFGDDFLGLKHSGDDDLVPESFPNAVVGNLILTGTFRRGSIGLVPDKSIRGRLPGFEAFGDDFLGLKHSGDDDLILESFPNAVVGNLISAGTFRRGRIGLVPDKSIRGRLPGFEAFGDDFLGLKHSGDDFLGLKHSGTTTLFLSHSRMPLSGI